MKKNESTKLIFIAGLGHSGSTLFDLLLGTQPSITGLGEIDAYINKRRREWYLERYDKYPCTCAQNPSECTIWGDFKDYIKTNSEKSYANIYGQLINIALEKTGSNIIVDSSKNIHALKNVYQSLPEIGLSKNQFLVIHLVKDMRSFTAASLQTGRNKNILRVAKHWIKGNKRVEQFLKENNIKTLNVGYDELALSTKYIIKKTCNFIFDHDNFQISTDISNSGSHIISGNNMRLDQADSIRYDYRWFNNWKVNLLYSFVPRIRELNDGWVYSNVNDFMDKETRFEPPKS